MTKKTIVSISALFILMVSHQAFAERGKDAGEGLKGAIEKVANTADARRGNGNGNGNGGGNGNGSGNDHGGDDHGGGHEDDGHPGHCRGNVSPC